MLDNLPRIMKNKNAFIFHRNKMDEPTYESIQVILKAGLKAGYIEKYEIPTKAPAAAKKTVSKNDYPEWFERIWKLIPIKIGKLETFIECQKVIKIGYTAEDIIKGIPGYAAEERERAKSDGYQKHHPCRWVKAHRFLDEQSHNPSVPFKTKEDLAREQEEPEGWVQHYMDMLGHGDFTQDWSELSVAMKKEILEEMGKL